MLDVPDPEDRQIRLILIGGGVAALVAALSALVLIAVMISMNFNFLNWME